jgi:hypothetical protein
MNALLLFLVMSLCFDWTDAFSIQSPITSSTTAKYHDHRLPKTCRMAAKKGFGDSSSPSKKKSVAVSPPIVEDADESARSTSTLPSQPEKSPKTDGQIALEKLIRERDDQKENELRSVRDLLAQDKLVQETPAVIPEKVAQRMGKRMLPFVGLPLFLGMGTFVGFWYFATYKNMEFQPAAVATTTVSLLVVGLLGITYSVLSASWDPDREGDFFGADEFKQNMENIKAGLSRSRDNAVLRDKIADVGDDQIRKALKDLEKKEQAEAKRTQSFASKLNDELE